MDLKSLNDLEYRTSSRAKRVSITIHGDGRVVVTIPPRGSRLYAERFVQSRISWIQRTRARVVRTRQLLPSGRSDYLAHRERARKLARERLRYFNRIYGFPFKSISVRDQKTRWGSCSRRGTLSFNYKIIHLPSHLADYVIVHELCHLKEFNHSERFWKLMVRSLPNPKVLRKELKTYRLH